MTIVAAIQLNTGLDVNANLAKTAQFIKEAHAQGAQLISLPENFALLAKHEAEKLSIKEPLGQGAIQDFLSQQAAEHKIWLLAGTIPIDSPNPDKAYACHLVFNPDGQCVTHYHKIHLFDVTVGDTERYEESAAVVPGNEVVTVETPLGCIGLSVCYDLRFPELYREQLTRGAVMLNIPAAFTEKTGKAHWEILLRARAIENLSYVIAPNQAGQHACGRASFGHSMIISPWGDILAECEAEEGVITADIDLNHLQQLRKTFPSPDHRCL